MKTTNFKMAFIALLAIVIVSLSSCTTKAQFLSSSVVPAARGTVQISSDMNKNYVINIKLYDLAGPERLTPPKSTYVVWLVTDDNRHRNIGQIIISNSLNASFEAVTSFRPSKIVITAEDEANAVYPSNTELIMTTAFLR
jgi:hypothetical protein